MRCRLVLSPLPADPASRERERYELMADYELQLWFDSDYGTDGITVLVPQGTVTDFASVPRWLWWLYPPDGPWQAAAVVHDYLYASSACSRFLADAIFRAAMEADGVPWWRAAILYYAVRIFGRAFR